MTGDNIVTCASCGIMRKNVDWCSRSDCPNPKPPPRILDGDVPYNCPSCGRPPVEEPICAGIFDAGKVSWSTTIRVGLWVEEVLIIFGDTASVAMTKEQAHALASRLHRYAEELS